MIDTIPVAERHDDYVLDASGFKGWADQVFLPRDEADVVEIVRRAAAEKVPLTVAGAGSGLTGGRVAQGGWVVSIEKFNRVEIGSGGARAGAAVSLAELRDAAVRTRQFFAPDPTETTASAGGCIATNASGSRSFLYGSTRRHVRALRVALMDGRVVEYRRGDKIDFDTRPVAWPGTTKCTAGYPLAPGMDWIDLFCGSEGTLGIILEAELALLPLPEELFSAVIFFGSDARALDAVDAWRGVAGLRMLEYVGREALDLIHSRYPDIPGRAAAALLIEAGGEADLDAWEARLAEAEALVEDSWFALSDADRERFRQLRHALPELVNATVLKRGFLKMGTDYAVPHAANRAMLAFYRERLEAVLPGQFVIYGHIGDSHVHVNMLPESGGQAETATGLLTEFAKQAVKLGGTVSAEHGLGKRKAHLLGMQYGPGDIAAMMDVKRRLDPAWLLGRGTLFTPPM